MKKITISGRIYRYNIAVILLLLILTSVIFKISISRYFTRSIAAQMDQIAYRAEEIALGDGPGRFPDDLGPVPSPSQDVPFFYFMLDQVLKEHLSVLNADYLLLDDAGQRITLPQDQLFTVAPELSDALIALTDEKSNGSGPQMFVLKEQRYIAVIKPVSDKVRFGLGWIILYSSMEKVEQIQSAVNIILMAILIFSAAVMALVSSHIAQKICSPFSQLDQHIRILGERRFDERMTAPVYQELQGLVDTVNSLSEKLARHDQAQKTFLQNVSHEFRTPLMLIQSHSEGIRHHVIEPDYASAIIIDETRRLTGLVDNLLYLSRLDALEEIYDFKRLSLSRILENCMHRMTEEAKASGTALQWDGIQGDHWVWGDEEKLERAICNLISNGIRHSEANVEIAISLQTDNHVALTVSDDGPGLDPDEIPFIFQRFYRGKSGRFGLGLSIVKTIADRHRGTVDAVNSTRGALFTLSLPQCGKGPDSR